MQSNLKKDMSAILGKDLLLKLNTITTHSSQAPIIALLFHFALLTFCSLAVSRPSLLPDNVISMSARFTVTLAPTVCPPSPSTVHEPGRPLLPMAGIAWSEPLGLLLGLHLQSLVNGRFLFSANTQGTLRRDLVNFIFKKCIGLRSLTTFN